MEVLSTSESGVGGLKEVIAIIEGQGVYSRLKYESGVHRVQRVPQTETQGRVHTSAVTVAVLPEAEDVDIKIEAKDIRIDTFCSSGPGGQSVNTTYSAVRITHLPTNTVVSCQDEKSQIKNREKGMRVLRARLYEMEQQKQQDALAKERKAMVGSGDRSEKIRTYNFPQNRVTDHRIGFTAHQLPEFMDGRIQPMIDALITHFQAEKLKQESAGASHAPDAPCKLKASARVGGGTSGSRRRRLAAHERRGAAHVRPRRRSRLSLRASRARTHAEEEARYDEVLAQRATGMPSQYITGHQEFWGLDFVVSPAVLIPRPETEHLVEAVLELARGVPHPKLVDVGTGSGCVALALAHEIEDAEVYAVDLSADALEIARANAARLQLEKRVASASRRCCYSVSSRARTSVRVESLL